MAGTIAPVAHFIQPVVTDEPFTDDYVVVFSAFAASDLGIVGGIASVKFYCEGNSQTVTTLGCYNVPAYGGVAPVLGYAAILDHSAFSGDGAIEIFAEVTPTKAGIATRVVGPMRMYRKTSLYDRTIDIHPGQSVITGARYQTLQAAFAYIDTNFVTNQHWRVRFIANATIDANVAWGSPFASVNKRGQIVIDGNGFDVTLGQSSWTSGNQMRPGLNSLVWLNIKVDFANVIQYYPEDGYKLAIFRNCEIFSSNGASEMPGNGGQGVGKSGRPNPVFRAGVSLESCYIHDIDSEGFLCMAQVGNRVEDVSGDAVATQAVGPYTIVGNRYKRISGSPLCNRLASIQLAYSGAGTPTYDITGGQEGATRTLLLKVNGTTVPTWGTLQASVTVGSGIYTMQDAVNYINAHTGTTGFSATLLDNTRRFATIGSATAAVGDEAYGLALSNVISGALDAHTDGFQINNGTYDNVLAMNNLYTDCEAQLHFWAAVITVWNSADIQNGRQLLAVGGLQDPSVLQTMDSGIYKHVLIACNTNANQRWTLIRGSGSNWDGYSRFIDNIAPHFQMLGDSSTPWDVTAFGNLAFAAAPGGNNFSGVNVTTPTVAGTALANFPNVGSVGFAANDFIPAVGQSARANLVPTQLPFDIFGNARGATCPAGIAD